LRKSAVLFICLGGLFALLLLTALDAAVRGRVEDERLALMARQVRELELTDLSLFTEARYTRHLSQADRHTPFQDHPMALEHFPSGSLLAPPDLLRPAQ